jgi:hypothetical protein
MGIECLTKVARGKLFLRIRLLHYISLYILNYKGVHKHCHI